MAAGSLRVGAKQLVAFLLHEHALNVLIPRHEPALGVHHRLDVVHAHRFGRKGLLATGAGVGVAGGAGFSLNGVLRTPAVAGGTQGGFDETGEASRRPLASAAGLGWLGFHCMP